MTFFFLGFTVFAVVCRIASLAVSLRHEAALKRAGGVEYGALNSNLLALCHVLFYAAAIWEGWSRGPELDAVAGIGIALYLLALFFLLYVIRLLGRLWTVKLIIAPDHELVTHPLFRVVRHPNYFLNIIPELIGLTLALHSYRTLAIGLPIYLLPLIVRIVQEEKTMRARFG
ncbi:isoprenylcysteine carboxylmethyltransferase family protein [Luteibacter sp.]|jgi:isoprenylcysteine carboxyl methyltransferase (ICMT) family protein YpbQ|uniref:isoprenylcysteine carboxylmethyltransferase family protein n=1 Tax=Luteibacter sp. TaxID=1886636 RepID=UPI002F3F2E2C